MSKSARATTNKNVVSTLKFNNFFAEVKLHLHETKFSLKLLAGSLSSINIEVVNMQFKQLPLTVCTKALAL